MDYEQQRKHDHRGVALTLLESRGGRVLFEGDDVFTCERGGLWTRRALRDTGTVRQWVADIAPQYGPQEGDDADTAKAKRAFTRSLRSVAGSNQVITILREQLIVDAGRTFDQRLELLAFQDGCVVTPVGAVESLNGADRVTVRIDAPIPSHADSAPAWAQFVEGLFPDEETREAVRMLVGYTLSPHHDLKAIPTLIGPADNGKSTFVRTLAACLGPYATDLNAATLTKDKHAGGAKGSPELMQVCRSHYRMVVVDEGDERTTFDPAIVKGLTSGTATQGIVTRHFKSNSVQLRPFPAVLWLATNHMPRFNGNDSAMERRLWPFRVPARQGAIDATLPARLMAERQGITRWALDACEEYCERYGAVKRMERPASVDEDAQALAVAQDSIRAFVEECCEFNGHTKTTTRGAYDAYRQWCIAAGVHSFSRPQFTARFRERFGERLESNANVSQYIRKADGGDGKTHQVFHGLRVVGAEQRAGREMGWNN